MTALQESLPYRFVQIANTPLESNLARLEARAHRYRTFLTHGTFSGLNRIVAKFNARKEILVALNELRYRGSPTEIAIAFLADLRVRNEFSRRHLGLHVQRGTPRFQSAAIEERSSTERLNAVIAELDMGAKD